MKGSHILIIDDHDDSCQAVKQMIERRGGEAECACTLKEGIILERVRREQGAPYDCIVSDLGFPESDAANTIHVLRGFISNGIPVRALSGASDPAIISACHDAGIKLILKGTAAEGIMESILYALAENEDTDISDVAEQIAENRSITREVPAHVAGWLTFVMSWPNWVKIVALFSTIFGLCASVVTTGAAVIKALDSKTIAAEAARQSTAEYRKVVDTNGQSISKNAGDIRIIQDAQIKIFATMELWSKQLDRLESKIDMLNNDHGKVESMWQQRLDRRTNKDMTPEENLDPTPTPPKK